MEQIAKASSAALSEPGFQHMLVEAGFVPDVDSNAEKFRRLIDEDIALWAPLEPVRLQVDP